MAAAPVSMLAAAVVTTVAAMAGLLGGCGASNGREGPAYDPARATETLRALEHGSEARALAEVRADLLVLSEVTDDDALSRAVAASVCRSRPSDCPAGALSGPALQRAIAAGLRRSGAHADWVGLIGRRADAATASGAVREALRSLGDPTVVGTRARDLEGDERRADVAAREAQRRAIDAGGHLAVVGAALALDGALEVLPLLADVDDAARISLLARVAPIACTEGLAQDPWVPRRCRGAPADDDVAWVARASLERLTGARRALDAADDPLAGRLRRTGWTGRVDAALAALIVPVPAPARLRLAAEEVRVPAAPGARLSKSAERVAVVTGERIWVARSRTLRIEAGTVRQDGELPGGPVTDDSSLRRAIGRAPDGRWTELLADARAPVRELLAAAARLGAAGALVLLVVTQDQGRAHLPVAVMTRDEADQRESAWVHATAGGWIHDPAAVGVASATHPGLAAVRRAAVEHRDRGGAQTLCILIEREMTYQQLADAVMALHQDGEGRPLQLFIAVDPAR